MDSAMLINVTPFIVGVIGVIVVALVVWIGNLDKNRADTMLYQIGVIESICKVAVQMAEQIFTKEQCQEKYEAAERYTLDRLREMGMIVEVEEIKGYLESAVLTLHAELEKQSATGGKKEEKEEQTENAE